MGLFGRFRGGRRRGPGAGPDLAYLQQWAGTRTGVEAYVEPQTRVTPLTVVLVAADGEWTRRPVGDAAGARKVGERLAIPRWRVAPPGLGISTFRAATGPSRSRDRAQRRTSG